MEIGEIARSTTKPVGPKYIYMKVKLISDVEPADCDAIGFKEIMLKSLKENFGEMGKSLPVDVLAFAESSKEAVLRCSEDIFNRLSSSLLFCREFRSVTWHFRILKVSYSSLALTSNSRTYIHNPSGRIQCSDDRKRKHE